MMAKSALADYLDGKALDYIEQSLSFLARLVFIYTLHVANLRCGIFLIIHFCILIKIGFETIHKNPVEQIIHLFLQMICISCFPFSSVMEIKLVTTTYLSYLYKKE